VLKTVSLSWSELGRRTWREAVDDDVPGLAAQLSYYVFLALFPALLFLIALASFFPLRNLTDDVGRSLGQFVSAQVLALIQERASDAGSAYWLIIIGRAIARGEARPEALHPRVATAAIVHLRNEYVTRGFPSAPDHVLVEIVDDIYLPLIRGRGMKIS